MGRVGMGGWLNFSSDHVEPIKADHGTQPPPPTSSTFFVLSLFPPRVLAFIHPLSATSPAPPPPRERERAFSFSDVPSSVSLPPARRATRRPPPSSRRRASSFHLVFLLSLLVHSLTLWQLVGFFRVTRRCNLFGRGREAPAEVVDEASGGWVGGTRATRGVYRGRIGGGGRGEAARRRR